MNIGKFGKIGIGWAIITASGIYGFILSKSSVDQKRFEGMQVRDRMRQANTGDYQKSERKFE